MDKPPVNKVELLKIEQSVELFSPIEQENLQSTFTEKPEIVADLEKSARFYLVAPYINKNKELSQDLSEYYQKYSDNQEWLNILKIHPKDLQKKIIEKRSSGTSENITEIKERLNEEWAKISEKFIASLFEKTKLLDETIKNGRFGKNYLVKEDEYKIKELVENIAGWLDQFVTFYAYKSELFPGQDVGESFGLKNFDPSEITLDEVRKNKDWYQKLDFFIEQYYKFFASGSKENRLESAFHFMDFTDHFMRKDQEYNHKNWQFLKNNLHDISEQYFKSHGDAGAQKEVGQGENKFIVYKFTPNDITESTRTSIVMWNYINQQELRFARIIPGGFYIQPKINNHIEPIPELSEKAKEIYRKAKLLLINSSFKNSKNETVHIKGIDFDSGEMELELNREITKHNYYTALKTSIPFRNHIVFILNKVTEK